MLTQALVPLLIVASAGFTYYSAVSPTFASWEEDWIATAEASPATMNVTWVDDGFAKYGEKKTYCFYPNATLSFQMEPLTSPAQPYVVQWFGQYEEARQAADVVVNYVEQIQELFPPFRSFLWTWSDLRIKLTSESRSQLELSYTSPISAPCQIYDNLDVLSSPYVQEHVPEKLQYVMDFFGKYVEAYCHGCRDGCPQACNGPTESCVMTKSPYSYPCITVHGPTTGMLLSSAQVSFVLEFKTYVDLAFAQNLLLGLIIYFSSEVLASYRVFHYFLGAAIGIVCSIALLLYQMYKQAQNTARLLPGSGFLQSASLFTTMAFPVTGLVLLPTLYRALRYALDLLFQFWLSESVMGVPHLGKLYFLFFGLMGCAMVWWFQWWAPTEASLSTVTTLDTNPDKHDDPDVLEDIRRMELEDLALPSSQKYLAWCLQVFAVMLLLQSTSSTTMSCVVVVLALMSSVLQALYDCLYFWYWSETPGMHSELISTDEFAAQAETETEKALRELQQYLRDHKEARQRVKSKNLNNVKAFSKGRDHLAEDLPERHSPGKKKKTRDDSGEYPFAQLREEAKLIDRLTRENQAKNEQLQALEIALSNEIEKHEAVVQVMRDKELTQKQETDHLIEVLNAKLCDYQVRMEACSTLDDANATLRSRVDELVRQLADENKNHVEEVHAMRLDMFNHKMALEQTFRKSLQELDAQYLKKAYNAMAEESKNALVANAKLKDELQMQSIGVENLMLRFKAQADQFHKMKVENEILEKGCSLRVKEISNLKTAHVAAEKKTAKAHAEELEKAQAAAVDLAATIEELKQENRQLQRQVEHVQKRCSKWKARAHDLANDKATPGQIDPSHDQEDVDALFTGPALTLERRRKSLAAATMEGPSSFDPRELWSASLAALPSSERCVTAPTYCLPREGGH
ncbi:protein kinase [Achlya hypogyna]|uniref:Protein kinase n=1 Tax=Achlya hypogyna TaxID=1202772 RepID=A0A1V9YB95_ACHHY|nr:protein kinase [Achlya hypogyna]